MTEKQGEFLTLGEAAKRFRVSRYKLTTLIAEGSSRPFRTTLIAARSSCGSATWSD